MSLFTNEVVNKLASSLRDKIDSRIEVKRDVTFHEPFAIDIKADIVLTYQGKTLAAFEIKKMPEVWAMRISHETIYQTAFTLYGIIHFIVCDDRKYCLCNRKKKKKTLDEIIELVEGDIPSLKEIPKVLL